MNNTSDNGQGEDEANCNDLAGLVLKHDSTDQKFIASPLYKRPRISYKSEYDKMRVSRAQWRSAAISATAGLILALLALIFK